MARYNRIKVVDVMTKNPLVMTPAETIGQADELMTENRIRQLPVVDEGALLGIITDRDIRSFLAQSALVEPEERAKVLRTNVREIMTAEPLTLAPDDDLREAIEPSPIFVAHVDVVKREVHWEGELHTVLHRRDLGAKLFA